MHTYGVSLTEQTPVSVERRLADMGLTYRLPVPPLDAYIDGLWSNEGPAPYVRLVLPPRPTLHVTVNLGEAFQVHGAGGAPGVTCGASWAAGVQESSYLVAW